MTRQTIGLLFLLLTGAVQAAAQITPCDPCEWSAAGWNAADTTRVNAGNGCIVDIVYRTRTCDHDDCLDIEILEMIRVGPCVNEDLAGLALLAVGDLLHENPMNFAPFEAGTHRCWRVVQPQCWRNADELCPEEGAMTPDANRIISCDTDNCCMNQLVVALDACDNLLFYDFSVTGSGSPYAQLQSFIDQYTPPNPCRVCTMPDGEGPPPTLHCFFNCHEELIDILTHKSSYWKN